MEEFEVVHQSAEEVVSVILKLENLILKGRESSLVL
jgi:hypothetical protein